MFKGTFAMKIWSTGNWVEQKNRPDRVVNVKPADVIDPNFEKNQ